MVKYGRSCLTCCWIHHCNLDTSIRTPLISFEIQQDSAMNYATSILINDPPCTRWYAAPSWQHRSSNSMLVFFTLDVHSFSWNSSFFPASLRAFAMWNWSIGSPSDIVVVLGSLAALLFAHSTCMFLCKDKYDFTDCWSLLGFSPMLAYEACLNFSNHVQWII